MPSYNDVETFIAELDARRVIVGPLVEETVRGKPHWLVLLAYEAQPFKIGAIAVSEITSDIYVSRMAALDQRRVLIESLGGKLVGRCNDEFCFVKAIAHEWRCDAVTAIRDFVDREEPASLPAE